MRFGRACIGGNGRCLVAPGFYLDPAMMGISRSLPRQMMFG
jgi:hypothetical protein